jgi:molecular chaperone GrpE
MTEKKHKDRKEIKALEQELRELSEQAEKLGQENQELLDKLKRVSADYANFQKRSAKQISESISFEKERIVKSLLPVMDNFEHTMAHTESAEDVEGVVKGVEIIYDQMLDVLKSHDVEQISALDEQFDPSLHQAMLQREDAEKEDGVVLEEYQRGYKLNGRVIRPAKVVVNKLAVDTKEPQEAEEGEKKEEVSAGDEENDNVQ